MRADLVPVYHLGQTQLLTFWGTEKISRTWRASVGLFWGQWGLPLPRKHQIITLVAPPIPGENCFCCTAAAAAVQVAQVSSACSQSFSAALVI